MNDSNGGKEKKVKLADAQRLAEKLMRENGLKGWRFGFDRARRRFGCCKFSKRMISLSKYLTFLNDEKEVRETILHEIAHAKAGHRAGHGPRWRKAALEVGCKPVRCYDRKVVTPKKRWIGECPSCGMRVDRDRRRAIHCLNCVDEQGGFNGSNAIRFRRNKG